MGLRGVSNPFILKKSTMSKRLPYFQFEPAEYLTKDIQFCSLAAQGLFINICAIYWQRDCELTITQVHRKYPSQNLMIEELIHEKIILIKNDKVVINFLDIQHNKAMEISSINSENGKKGGRPKKPIESETKPTALIPLSESKGNKIKKIKEDKEDIPAFTIFLAYAKEHKPKVDALDLKLKYEAWKVNDWKDGNNKPIKNWKTKVLNTLPHIKEIKVDEGLSYAERNPGMLPN